MKKLVVATKNVGKAKEVVEMLANLPYKVLTLADFPDAPDVEETGSSFAENAILKAVEYAKFTGELTLADDSGLEVDALNGAPGIYSSRFAPTDFERNAKSFGPHEKCSKPSARCKISLRYSDCRPIGKC